jgi:hypothetical protein
MLRSLLSSRVLALGLACALAACGGGNDAPNPGGSGGGSGGTGGSGATGGSGGGEGGSGGTGGTGGGTENCVAPIIERLEPDNGYVGTSVTVFGRCFGPAGKNNVQFNGSQSAVFQVAADGTQLTTSVPANATTGKVTVFTDYGSGPVRRDGPVFTVSDETPVPTLNTVSPGFITVGENDALLVTLSGTGFYFGSEVLLDGEKINATYQSTTSLEAQIPASLLSNVRVLNFQVRNQPPGGGTSAEVAFKVVARLNLVGATATAANRVVLTFDRPVDRGIAEQRNAYRVAAGASTLAIQKADRAQNDARRVILTTGTQSPNLNYAVTVHEEMRSTEGGLIDQRQAGFRAYGSDPELAGSFGATGCGAATLSTPAGLTATSNRLYVTELEGHQVQYVNLDGTFGGFLGNNGTVMGVHADGASNAVGCPGAGSTATNAFSYPRGAIALDTTNRLYVGDTGNDRVFRFSAAGGLEGPFATGVATWESPVVLGFARGSVWIANGDDMVYRVPPVGAALAPLFGSGIGAGQFDFAVADGEVPAMAESGDAIFITDPGNHRVQKFIDDAVSPRGWIGKGHTQFVTGSVDCLSTDTCAGTANGEFTSPRGIVVDGGGALWVIDEANGGRVQKFSDTGEHLLSFDLGYMPGGIAVDADGFLWIADQTTNQVHRYGI